MANRKPMYYLEDLYDNNEVQHNWNLKILDAKQVRAVLKIFTNQGVFALKKVKHDPMKMQFIFEAQEHLWQNKFHMQPRLLRTVSGCPFVEVEDGLIFLSSWIEGKESNLEDPRELKEVVRLQAKLHKASRGFSPSNNAYKKPGWDNWIERHEQRLEEIKDTYNGLKTRKPETKQEKVFLETSKPMIEMAETSVRLLKDSPYQKVLCRARQECGFIHGDFTYHNFIRTKNGDMNVIDFDYCAQNLRVQDFAHFMRKILRRTDWSIKTGNSILRTYHEVDSIHEDELALLRAVLYFPKRYWRVVKREFDPTGHTKKDSNRNMRNDFSQLENWKRYLDAFPVKL